MVLMVCTGIDDNTDLVSVTRPAKLSILLFQPVSRDETLSGRGVLVNPLGNKRQNKRIINEWIIRNARKISANSNTYGIKDKKKGFSHHT